MHAHPFQSHFQSYAMNLGPLFASFGSVIAICYAIVAILVGFAVYSDAQALKANEPGRLRVLSPVLWGLLCAFGNVPALALYWAAHYSSLAKP